MAGGPALQHLLLQRRPHPRRLPGVPPRPPATRTRKRRRRSDLRDLRGDPPRLPLRQLRHRSRASPRAALRPMCASRRPPPGPRRRAGTPRSARSGRRAMRIRATRVDPRLEAIPQGPDAPAWPWRRHDPDLPRRPRRRSRQADRTHPSTPATSRPTPLPRCLPAPIRGVDRRQVRRAPRRGSVSPSSTSRPGTTYATSAPNPKQAPTRAARCTQRSKRSPRQSSS